MPTYQYACTECDHRFEQFQSFNDDSLTQCPVCHGRLRKVFNAVGVVFKGSGFYRTDSRDAAKKQSSSSDSSGSSGSSDSSSSGDGGTEAPKKDAAPKESSPTAKKPTEASKTPSKSPTP